MLEGFVQQEDERFVSADLDALRGISATTMTNTDVKNIDDAALKGVDAENPNEVYRPIITFQNKFDESEFIIGDPQFFGGNGLTTRYFTADNVTFDATDYDNITNDSPQSFEDEDGNIVTSEVYWENGNYTFVDLLDDSLPDGTGCIEWNGYFRPTISGTYGFDLYSTGMFTFEFNAHGPDIDTRTDSLTFKKVHPVISNVSVNVTSGSSTAEIPETETLYGELIINQIGRQDLIVGTESPFNEPETNPVSVTEVNYSGNTFEMSAPSDVDGTITLQFVSEFGTETRFDTITGTIKAFNVYPIRIRYFWIPGYGEGLNPPNDAEKYFRIVNREIFGGRRGLNYRYLYAEDYDTSPTPGENNSGDFYEFVESRVPSGGTILFDDNTDDSIGTEDGFSGYQNVITKSNLVLKYEPPLNYNDIIYERSLSYSAAEARFETTNTDGVESGNLVIGTDIEANTFVDEISPNRSIFLTKTPTSSGTDTIYFVRHQGLKGYDLPVTYTQGTNVIGSVDSELVSRVSIGDVVIVSDSSSSTTWTRITGVPSATEIEVSDTFGADSPGSSSIDAGLYVYASAGIEDTSLNNYCQGTIGAETTQIVSGGSTTIPIDNIRLFGGEATGSVPIGYFVFYGDRIPEGTTVTASDSSSITISNPTNDIIGDNQTLVFVETNEAKDLCFPPADTSPPFIATEDGLRTTSTRPTLEVNNENGEIKFVNLLADNVTVTEVDPNDSYDTTITIKDGNGNTFNVLSASS